jgi:fucose permease
VAKTLSSPDHGRTRFQRPPFTLILLAFVAYVSLGLPDGLLGIAWPSIRRDFSLPLDSLGALLITATIGYLASSFFGGRLMAHFRLGTLLALSTAATGAALLGYTVAPSWWTLVAIGVVAGLGGGGIDVALNTYVASNHGEGTMQWLHASYGIGATIGPAIMTVSIVSFGGWRWGYTIVAAVQLALMVSFLFTVSLWEASGDSRGVRNAEGKGHPHTPTRDTLMRGTVMRDTLSQPPVWLGAFLFLVYMGVEVTLGTWSYTLLTESRGISPRLAGLWMSGFWGIFTIGRIAAGVYASCIGRRTLIIGCLLAALAASLLLAVGVAGFFDLAAVTIMGFAIAPVLPALISGTTERVGSRHTGNAIGIQIAAMGAGAAIMPSIAGVIARRLSLEAIPPFLILMLVVVVASCLASFQTGRERA